MPGALAKLTILSYKDCGLKKIDLGRIFVAYFNPAQYSVSGSINHANTSTPGNQGEMGNFQSTPGRMYSFELQLDGTGTSGPLAEGASALAKFLPSTPVSAAAIATGTSGIVPLMVIQFERTCYDFDSEIHEPRKVLLNWGPLAVKAVLQTYSVTYSMFNSLGVPIRAKLNCTFKEIENQELLLAKMRKLSPDLTRVVKIREGDNLQLLCDEIYGDASLYLEVARYNKLRNYRKLESGQEIVFPPLRPN